MTVAPAAAETALERTSQQASRLAQVSGFTDQQIALISQTVAPGATRLELAWFLYNAGRLHLEPTLKQIYFIKYSKDQPGEIVTGIDGYRAKAEESGCYAGSDDPVYEYEQVGQPPNAPSKATVTVWKLVQGQRVPFTASARWLEFYPGPGKIGEQYRKRPHNQLAIRAESHALRKGFPHQTQSLEVRQEAPQAWHDAAALDESARMDPALVAANARRYDEIFGSDEDVVVVETSAGRQVQPATGEVIVDVPAPPVSRSDRWAENRRLTARAQELGVTGIPVLNTRAGDDQLDAANATLAERIRNIETDQDLAAEQGALV